jgi:hypothetical protein
VTRYTFSVNVHATANGDHLATVALQEDGIAGIGRGVTEHAAIISGVADVLGALRRDRECRRSAAGKKP